MARCAENRPTLVVLLVAVLAHSASARVVVVRREEAPTREALEKAVLAGLVTPSLKNNQERVRAFVAGRSLTRDRYAVLFGSSQARKTFKVYEAWRGEVRVHAPERFPAIVTQRGFGIVRALDASSELGLKQIPIEQARIVHDALAGTHPVYAVALEDSRGERIYIGVFVYQGGRWWVAPMELAPVEMDARNGSPGPAHVL